MYEYILGNDLTDEDDGRKEEEARLSRPSDIDGAIRAPHQGELFSRCVLCAEAEVRNGLGGSGIPYLASQRCLLSEGVSASFLDENAQRCGGGRIKRGLDYI